jgi:DNA polymerase-1
MSKKRLFLLDAYALIFRGYYALIKNPRINSKGEDTSAIMGFVNSLFDVIKREQPDHLAVCFDKGGSSERTQLFPEYKANRLETPDAIRLAVPYIQEILRAMQIPVVVLEGLEADDIIGTLAKQAEKEDYQVFMVTPDKDFGQLVSENIFMYRPARMGNGIEIWGIPEIQKRFGVERPEQVIDYLGMMGDASDNIPGLPGVGEKTAKKFLADFGSMENLLANTDQLKGKMKEKVSENAALGLLSKKLATINIHCDVTFNAAAYELTTPDSEKVQAIFEKLEFRRLTEQFLRLFFAPKETPNTPEANTQKKAEATTAGSGQFGLFDNAENSTDGGQIFTSRKTINEVSHHYQLVSPGLGMKLFTQKILQQSQVCFDAETTSLDPLEATLVGLAFSWEAHKGFYISLPEDQEETSEILSELKAFFHHEGIEKVGQNLKYDLKVLHRYGIEVKGPCFDTMLAHYLINPDMRHNLSVLSETYLNYTPIAIEALIGKGKQKITMREVDLEQQVAYAVEDSDLCFQLAQQFKTELAAAGNESLFIDMEVPLLRVLAGMELEGINLDVAFLNTLSVTLDKDILQLENDIYEAAGETFNIASPKQLGDILFGKMHLAEKPKKTKTGQYSTAEDVLSYLAKEHKIIADVIAYRGLAKLKSTYVDALPLQVSAQTGRVHTDYMQTVAATGRLSSNNPNLQNIPIRTERGKQIRKAFIPRDQEHLLLAADYSQIELRIIAALSQEDNMIAAFKEGADIHASTAAKVFNVPLESVSREQRSHAKTVNFGIIYGVSAFGLSNQTDLSRAESKALIDTYYESYPKLKAYMNSQVNFARENGYVETVLGRRRYLKDINANNAIVRGAAERNAVNAPIQGSAADIIKLAMIAVQKALDFQKLRTKMLLQVHDELVFDVYKPELEQVKELVKSAMENAFTLSVPLDVDLGVGENWLEAH